LEALVKNGLTYLRVKLRSLAAEARVIKHEERRAKRWRQTAKLEALRDHRIHVVRDEARHSHLAYGFIRGVPYRAMEHKCRHKPELNRIVRMVQKYGQMRDGTIDDWYEATLPANGAKAGSESHDATAS
jgi:hypothetical protein